MNSNITGERIKELRKEHKLTQSELGEIVGVQKSAIAKYERGEIVNLKRETIEKLSHFFKVKPSYLMGMEDNKYKSSNVSLDDVEVQIIHSYRQASDPIKKAVNVLLGVDEKDE